MITKGFERLEFEWDANKESEMSGIPDLEIDIATIEHQNKFQINKSQKNTNNNTQKIVENSNSSNNLDDDNENDPNWNFEISEWDDSCLKELSTTSIKQRPHPTSNMFHFQSNYASETVPGSEWNRWNDLSTSKTLFIDPNDMDDLFGDEFVDTDDEEVCQIKSY